MFYSNTSSNLCAETKNQLSSKEVKCTISPVCIRCLGGGTPTVSSTTVLQWNLEMWHSKKTPAPLPPLQFGSQVWGVTSLRFTLDSQMRLVWKSWGRWYHPSSSSSTGFHRNENVHFNGIPINLSTGINFLWFFTYSVFFVYDPICLG